MGMMSSVTRSDSYSALNEEALTVSPLSPFHYPKLPLGFPNPHSLLPETTFLLLEPSPYTLKCNPYPCDTMMGMMSSVTRSDSYSALNEEALTVSHLFPFFYEAGSYLRLIDSCITQRKAQGSSRTCNESNDGRSRAQTPTLPSTRRPSRFLHSPSAFFHTPSAFFDSLSLVPHSLSVLPPPPPTSTLPQPSSSLPFSHPPQLPRCCPNPRYSNTLHAKT